MDIEVWLRASRLRLNPSKTQIMILGSAQQLAKVTSKTVDLLSSEIKIADAARNPGVIFDCRLSMSAQVSSTSRSCYYQLKQLRPIARCMSTEALKTTVHAFISSRLDCSNVLYDGITNQLIRRLQSIQNAAARLVTRTARREHITPVLRELHWLPVVDRVRFKMATLAYRCLAGSCPPYLSEERKLTSSVATRRLRSSDERTCCARRSQSRFGDRSFATSAPRIWNSLPSSLRSQELSYECFRRGLKSYLFGHGAAALCD